MENQLTEIERLQLSLTLEKVTRLRLQIQLDEDRLKQLHAEHAKRSEEQKSYLLYLNEKYSITTGDQVEIETGKILRVVKTN